MFTIRDVAHQTGITPHTLRYYERIGLIVDVPRDGAGHRRYGERDVRWLDFLTKLRRTGMGVEDMVKYARLVRQGPATAGERCAMLEAHRDEVLSRIAELQRHLGVLDHKITMYKNGEMT